MLVVEGHRRTAAGPPVLQSGDKLRSQECLRRYEGMPEVKKAELIEAIVYLGSPVSAEQHAEPDGLIHTWLGTYAARTPGVRLFTNATVILDADNTPQPDACLCLKPGAGGRVKLDKYLVGPPELIVEIAASSAGIDLRDKMDAYARNGVGEYLVWRTLEARLDWFILENQNYVALPEGRPGRLSSRTFPGLVLDASSLLARNAENVLAALHCGLISSAHQRFAASLR